MRLLKKLPKRSNQLLAIGLTFAGFAAPDLPQDPPREWRIVPEAQAAPNAETRARHVEVARHFAPAFYQDTDSSYYVGDLITRFNFDGDYNGKNNWESLEGRRSVPAYVYYAVSETESHYFLNYSVFHPRDWHEYIALDRHENDLEGVTVAVRKNAGMGEVVAVATLAHGGFWTYSNRSDIEPGLESIDGPLSFRDTSHARIYIEPKGHGIYGCDERCDQAPDGDGILYEVGDRADSPAAPPGNYTRHRYALIAMDADGSDGENQGLWHRRNDICDTCTFGAWGKLRGDNYGENRAATPWTWRDSDQGPLRSGDMLCDPAFFFNARFNGAAFDGGFSHRYVAHPFRTHFMKEPGAAATSSSLASFFGGTSGEPRLNRSLSEHFLCRRELARPRESLREIAGNRAP